MSTDGHREPPPYIVPGKAKHSMLTHIIIIIIKIRLGHSLSLLFLPLVQLKVRGME